MDNFILIILSMLSGLFIVAPKRMLKVYFLVSLMASIALGFYLGYVIFDFVPYELESSVFITLLVLIITQLVRAYTSFLRSISENLIGKAIKTDVQENLKK